MIESAVYYQYIVTPGFIKEWLQENYFQYQQVNHNIPKYEGWLEAYAERGVDQHGAIKGILLELLFMRMVGMALEDVDNISPRYSTIWEDDQNVDVILQNGLGTMGVSLKSSSNGASSAKSRRNKLIKKKQVPVPYVVVYQAPENIGALTVAQELALGNEPQLGLILVQRLADQEGGLFTSISRQITQDLQMNPSADFIQRKLRREQKNPKLKLDPHLQATARLLVDGLRELSS